jgi:DNA-binding protein H-NS
VVVRHHRVERIIPFGADQGERPQKSPQKRPVKYVNPSDESETWTGRGHRPRWLKQKLADGHRVEDFLVNGAGGEQ